MKKIAIYTFCFFLVFTSCKQNDKEGSTEKEPTSKKENSIDHSKSKKIDISSIESIIQGIWLPRTYVQDIYETQSAFSAYRSIPDIAEMQINPNEIRNDTLYVGSSLNNHEGYGFRIWFAKENDQIIIQTDVRDWDSEQFDFEVKYVIEQDTMLQLVTKDKAGNVKDSIDYLRIRNKEFITDFGGLGYEYLARKILLNGSYKILDSTKSNLGEAYFNADNASIQGFKFKYYTILTDFGGGPSFEGDHIIFRPEEEDYKNTESYVLQNVSDTLILYSTEEKVSDSDYEIILKDKIYYLIKNKN